MKKFFNGVFLALIILILILGIGKALVMPEEINEYENRYSERLSLPDFKNFYSGDYQESVEIALADQLLFAVQAKEIYNQSFSIFNKTILDYVTANDEETEEVIEDEFRTINNPNAKYYTLASGIQMLEGHLMYPTRFLNNEKGDLDLRIENINKTIEKFPSITFYAYYIEKETDIDFVTGERSNIFEYLRDNINLPEEQINRFNVTKFEDFDKWFYLTDHHLNFRGGFECYKQLLSWMLPEETPLQPEGQYRIGYYSGSKAIGKDADAYRDINTCYKYNFPEMITYENGKKIGYYGAQEYYMNKVTKQSELLKKVSYGQLFGQDSGEVRFENPEKDTGSILLFGESMDNAILRLFASHYSKLYSVDLRNYPKQMGEKFDLEKYLEKYPDITKVMFIGNLDMFTKKDFNLK